MTLKHHKPHICVLNDKCTEFNQWQAPGTHHVGTLTVPISTNENSKAQKTHTDKNPLHRGQTDSRNCEVYHFIGLITLRKPFRDQVTGIELALKPMGGSQNQCESVERGLGCRIKGEGKEIPRKAIQGTLLSWPTYSQKVQGPGGLETLAKAYNAVSVLAGFYISLTLWSFLKRTSIENMPPPDCWLITDVEGSSPLWVVPPLGWWSCVL